jgi:hypothetical protein
VCIFTNANGVRWSRRRDGRLEEAIGAAVDALLAEGTCGEASTGIRLRDIPQAAP